MQETQFRNNKEFLKNCEMKNAFGESWPKKNFAMYKCGLKHSPVKNLFLQPSESLSTMSNHGWEPSSLLFHYLHLSEISDPAEFWHLKQGNFAALSPLYASVPINLPLQ